MDDIAPELYKKIEEKFNNLISSDEQIKNILSGENREASFADVSRLSRRAGEYAVRSLICYLTEEELPGGRLHWNIAQRTIVPIMKKVYEIVNQMAEAVQTREDKKLRIGIKPIKAEFPAERIDAVINKLLSVSVEETADE